MIFFVCYNVAFKHLPNQHFFVSLKVESKHRTLDMVNSSMGSLVQTRQTLEDNLYCAKVIFVFATLSKNDKCQTFFAVREKLSDIERGV